MSRTLLLVLLTAVVLSAQPVATLTTGGDVKVNGTAIPTTGAPTWPLATGDTIETTADLGVMTFPDGARATLARNSRVILKVCDRYVVRLELGSTNYKMPQDSKLQICALGHPVKPAPLTEGSVAIENGKVFVQVVGQGQVEAGKGNCSCEAGAAWLGKHKVPLIILGAGAAATVAAIAVTRPGAPSASVPTQ